MKRYFGVIAALLLSASLAHAGAIADNDQFGIQDGGGFSAAGAPGAFHLAGAAGAQGQIGYSAAEAGDFASQSQLNLQTQSDVEAADDGAGNFSGAGWQTEQYQFSGSEAGANGGPGISGDAQIQGLAGGSAGLTTGGTSGVAGSAGFAGGLAASGSLGDAGTATEQYQTYDGVYAQQSVSPNGGYVYQEGAQSFGTATYTNTGGGIGIAGAGAGVIQAGGSVVANNGSGTVATGQATAAGEAGATSFAVGNADAGAQAYGAQTHSYEQYNTSADGSQQQLQQGSVTTIVTADSVSP